MQRDEDSEADSSLEVAPPIGHTVPWRVVAVETLAAHRLRVSFMDGTQGEVDLGTLLASAAVEGTVFAALRDLAEFDKARVVLGAVQWPCGADLAPDAMYDAIREPGRWTVGAP